MVVKWAFFLLTEAFFVQESFLAPPDIDQIL